MTNAPCNAQPRRNRHEPWKADRGHGRARAAQREPDGAGGVHRGTAEQRRGPARHERRGGREQAELGRVSGGAHGREGDGGVRRTLVARGKARSAAERPSGALSDR